MKKKVAITQSNYIPWKGYFDMINLVDEFILYDDVQYTKRDWRNRNLIKGPGGLQWLTIPVNVKGKYFQSIKDTIITDNKWAKNHWKTIRQNYAKAKFFREYAPQFEEFYNKPQSKFISEVNYKFLKFINDILGINTTISWSSGYSDANDKNENLLAVCKQAGANVYISGPAAKSYFDTSVFKSEGIEVEWMDYSSYVKYPQLYPPFDHCVSIIDLIFSVGNDFKPYFKSL